ncbi:MAG: DUF4124 domain-containing protein [Candidatus Nitrotoga sp.]
MYCLHPQGVGRGCKADESATTTHRHLILAALFSFLTRTGITLALLLLAPSAHAEIYKSIAPDGQVTYSSVPTKGAKKMDLGILPKPPVNARNNPTPHNFPKIDSATQKNRDQARNKILQNELTSEIKLLDESRQQLADSIANPELYVNKDGKAMPDPVRHADKIKSLRRRITLHEHNIEALQAELPKPH